MFEMLLDMGGDVSGATEIPYVLVSLKLLCALLAGAVIGFERAATYGRPAGIRTYCLVCLSSTALVQAIVHMVIWMPHVTPQMYRADSTRLMQAVSEGIAFLCIGIIFRQGMAFRGLTSAAAIWVTAFIGILFGIGFFALGWATFGVLLVLLYLFRQIERLWNARRYAHCQVVFARDGNITRESFLEILAEHHLELSGRINHVAINDGKDFELALKIRSCSHQAFSRLAETLRRHTEFKRYSIQFIRN